MSINSAKRIFVLILCFACFQTANAVWIKQNSGTLAWLRSVYFTNPNKGWIVGGKGTFLTTDDGGKTWRQNKKITEDNIRDVYFSDEKNGWLLCERNIYSAGSQPLSYLMKTFDGGESWEKSDFSETRERLSRILFAPDGSGYAVGESGAFLMLQNDKKTWKKSALPVRYLMLGGKFTDASHGLLVGGGGTILFTEDSGSSWNQAKLDDDPKTKLASVFFVDRKTGWSVGDAGKIYFTNNGGKLWRGQSSDVVENLSDVFFVDPQEGFAVGDGGRILHTATAGKIWKIEKSNVRHKLEKVFFVEKKGFAVGFGGTILTYDSAQPSSQLSLKLSPQKSSAANSRHIERSGKNRSDACLRRVNL